MHVSIVPIAIANAIMELVNAMALNPQALDPTASWTCLSPIYSFVCNAKQNNTLCSIDKTGNEDYISTIN